MSEFSKTNWGADGAPFKPNDWVWNGYQVALVKDVMKDFVRREDGSLSEEGEVLLHLIIYSKNGDKIGRESPFMGGPRTFEPCCSINGWTRIETPEFPLRMKWIPSEIDPSKVVSGYEVAKLPMGKFFPRKRTSKTSVSQANFDADREAYALRRSAQELRDMARKLSAETKAELIAKAESLEKEARALSS